MCDGGGMCGWGLVVRGVHGRGMCGRGGACMAGGRAWWGACMAGGGVACVVGETATAADGTHPT